MNQLHLTHNELVLMRECLGQFTVVCKGDGLARLTSAWESSIRNAEPFMPVSHADLPLLENIIHNCLVERRNELKELQGILKMCKRVRAVSVTE